MSFLFFLQDMSEDSGPSKHNNGSDDSEGSEGGDVGEFSDGTEVSCSDIAMVAMFIHIELKEYVVNCGLMFLFCRFCSGILVGPYIYLY